MADICPDAKVLLQLGRGNLAPEQREQAQQHLAGCQACQRRLVALLLSPSSEVSSSDEHQPPRTPSSSGEGLSRGTSLGRYVILDLLGSGGMGVVYSAYDPELDRRVALKLLRADATSVDARARLLREARAIARLSHPNVVTVYDVGTAGEAVFITMELVKGENLRQWLFGQHRERREILKAFIDAGRGLAAAHAVGLIHRDFKPDNVLMGEDGRARVTDFGLARAVAEAKPEVLESTIAKLRSDPASPAWSAPLTEPQAVVGTLPYMAPEQLSGEAADAKSDQFSFCVSLYEALYGERPFDGDSVSEVQERMLKGPIATPDKKTLVPLWLHRVVLRGISANSEQRYASIDALLSALQADPEALRRQHLTVAAVATLIVATIAGSFAYVRHLRPSCDQAAIALRGVWDEERKDAMSRAFLATGKSFASDAWNQTSRDLDRYAEQWAKGRTLACHAAQEKRALPDITALRALCLDQRLEELRATTDLLLRPDAELIASAVVIAEGLSPVAECENLSSLALRSRTPADSKTRLTVESLQSRVTQAEVQRSSGRYKEGLATAAGVVEEARRLGYRPTLVDALCEQASLQYTSGDARSAESTGREAVRLALEDGYERGAAKATTLLVWIAGVENNQPKEGHLWADQASGHIARLGGDDLLQAYVLASEGIIYGREGQYQRAMDNLVHALDLQEKVLGSEHVEVAKTLNKIGTVLGDLGRHPEAMERFRRSIDIETNLLGPKNPHVGMLIGNLGAAYLRLQRLDEARPTLEQSLRILEESLGQEHFWVAYPLLNLGEVAALEGRYPEGKKLLERSLAIFEKLSAPNDPRIAQPLEPLGMISQNQGYFAEALRYYLRELALIEKGKGPDHPDLIEPLARIASVYCEQGKYLAAKRMLDRAQSVAQKSLASDHESVGLISDAYGQVWLATGQTPRAIAEFQKALSISTKMFSDSAPQVGDRLAHLGIAYLQWHQPKLARPLLERANRIALAGHLDPRQFALRQFALAKALWFTKADPEQAIELAARARRLLNQSNTARRGEEREMVNWLRNAQHGAFRTSQRL